MKELLVLLALIIGAVFLLFHSCGSTMRGWFGQAASPSQLSSQKTLHGP